MTGINIKEIHVNGALCPELHDLMLSDGGLWRQVHESAEIIIGFDAETIISAMEIQFWTTCYPNTIRISAETMNVHSKLTWTLFSTENLAQARVIVNRTVKVVGPFPPTRRLKLDFDGGHIDPLFRRFKLGLKRLCIEGLDLQSISAPSVVESSAFPTIAATAIAIPTHKVSDKEVAPLFAFPDAQLVMSAVLSDAKNAWILLSRGSLHRKKLAERRDHELLIPQYILPPHYPASAGSIPTRLN